MRRVLAHPRPLLAGPPDLARTGPEQLLRAAAGPGGPVVMREEVRSHGPHLVSTGWWCGEERRVYHFIEDAGGAILWVNFAAGRWYLQGRVE